MARIFFSYSHKDEEFGNRLDVHLQALQRSGQIEVWHDRRIVPGDKFADQIDENIEKADIILLLVSADFIASDYCYNIEMERAMKRHENGDAKVIPIILNFCHWQKTPFANLQALPKDAREIAAWPNWDEAFLDVVKGIEAAIPEPAVRTLAEPPQASRLPNETGSVPRSSNLRVRRQFTDAERNRYLYDSFQYMKRFFQSSLDELDDRNAQVEMQFREIDADTFTAIIFENGCQQTQCRVRIDADAGRGITYSNNLDSHGNSCNEALSVESDEISLYLKPLGLMSHHQGSGYDKLTQEGAAEFFWAALMRPLQ